MRRDLLLILIGLSAFTFVACDPKEDEHGSGIVITEEGCCTPEEEVVTNSFLSRLTEVDELRGVANVDDTYGLKFFTADGKFHKGYNEVYVAATKTKTDEHVKDFNVSDFVPLMTMSAGHKHSTIVGPVSKLNNVPIYKLWVSFLMPTSEMGTWELNLNYEIKKGKGNVANASITVEPEPGNRNTIASFKKGDDTYYVTLTEPNNLRVGSNRIQAYVAKKGADMTQPYEPVNIDATIAIEPTMPDMGGHTSPGNRDLERQIETEGLFQGTLNLSMTGLWDVTLTLQDAEGDTPIGKWTLEI